MQRGANNIMAGLLQQMVGGLPLVAWSRETPPGLEDPCLLSFFQFRKEKLLPPFNRCKHLRVRTVKCCTTSDKKQAVMLPV